MEIRFFDDSIELFLRSLDEPLESKAGRVIDLLERYGARIGMPQSKSLGQGLFELRTLGHPQIRIIYTYMKGDAVLLHGFIKSTKRIPIKEFATAIKKKRLLEKR